MAPPPEQVSHDSQPGICSMLLIAVPAGAEGGLGDGFGFPGGVVGGGVGWGLGALEGLGAAVGVLVEGGAAEFAVGTGDVLSGADAVPPHPAISKSVAHKQVCKNARGTNRISRF